MGGGELIVEGVEGVEARREKLANVSKDAIGGLPYQSTQSFRMKKYCWS